MKTKLISVLIVLSGLVSNLLADNDAEKYNKEDFMKAYGWVLGKSMRLEELQLTNAELDIFLKGMKMGVVKEDLPFDIEDIRPYAQKWIEGRLSDYKSKIAVAQQRESAEFINKLLSENKKIQKTDTGLYYEVIEPGNNVRADAVDQVTVHYTGKLLNGTVFDSTDKGRNPATFELGKTIKGFSQGLQMIGEGGKIKLYIPPHLGYGSAGTRNIPPNAYLNFDMHLISIAKKQEPVAEKQENKPVMRKRVVATTPPISATAPETTVKKQSEAEK